MFQRVDTVFIYVKNIETAVVWYQDILKLEIAMAYPGYVAFKLGETYLTLIENEQQINRQYSSFNLFVIDAKKIHQYLTNQGVKITPLENHGVDHFAFYDLDGNRLEVCSF